MIDYQQIIDFIRSVYPNRDFIPLHEPVFAGNEKKYVLDCIDSTFVSSVGKYVDRFEEMVRDFTGANYAIAAVNGTAALHMSLLLAGVQRGDLVITQPLTFIATCNAISYCGADSVFIDIDRKTLGLSADALEEWLSKNAILSEVDGVMHCFHYPQMDSNKGSQIISNNNGDEISTHSISKPKPFSQSSFVPICDFSFVQISGLKRISACVPMHTFGHPCEIDRIVEICAKYYIPVVEDSAESIGSYYRNKHTGTFGLLGILSFNGNKTITTGGGGMILTNDKELAIKAKHLTTQAKKPHPWNFEHDHIGYNYRLPNINAALGCAQMESIPAMLKSKRETAAMYNNFFAKIPDIEFVNEPINSISNFWLNVILLKNKTEQEAFLKLTNDNKVMTRPAWMLMNELEMFKDAITADIPVAREIADRLVNIPSSVRTI